MVGREDDLEKLNRKALRIAREVADETGTLMAGNLSKTTLVKPGDKEVENAIYKMFEVRSFNNYLYMIRSQGACVCVRVRV